MGHIEDRWIKSKDGRRVKTERHGKGDRYRVRYLDPDGRERSKSFPDRAKGEAERFLTTVEAAKLRGSYIDPARGRRTLEDYAPEWLASQPIRPTSRRTYDAYLRVWILPALGARPSLRSRRRRFGPSSGY